MKVAKALASLIEEFEKLPGIGPKSAQRLAYYLLHVPQAELDRFAQSLSGLKKNTLECSICHYVDETDPCSICRDMSRDQGVICVVQQPLDVVAFERGRGFRGVYHVLHGVIDPLHNIGPEEIMIGELLNRVKSGGVEEVILALNPNMEGEATCMYISKQIPKDNVKLTRLAHGLPIGADIEYADEVTLNRALEGRRDY